MPVGTNQHANFVLGLFQHFLIGGPGSVRDALAGAVDLKVRFDGNVDETVLRLAEDASFCDGHANYSERPASYLDGLAERVGIAEQLVLDVRAQYGDRRVVLVLDFSEIAARSNLS